MMIGELAVFGIGIGLLAMAVDKEIHRAKLRISIPDKMVNMWVDETRREDVEGWIDANALEQAKAMLFHGDVALVSLGGTIGYDVLVYLVEQSFLGMRMPMIAIHKTDFETRERMVPLLDIINNVRLVRF